jgi:O-Antigen ligase
MTASGTDMGMAEERTGKARAILRFLMDVPRRFALWFVSIWVPNDRVLGGYYQPPSPQWRSIRRWIVLSLITFVGMIYGFLVSIFPVAFYTYLAMPIVFILLLVIWILPEAKSVPRKLMTNLFFIFYISFLLWPNYLAIAIPGLPWITMIRLWSVPLAIVFLVSLSVSPAFRGEVTTALKTNPMTVKFLLAFVFMQIVTLPFSFKPFDSLNKFIDSIMTWSGLFLVAVFVFLQPGMAKRWTWQLCAMAVILCLIGEWEYHAQGVLWAGHIPSFLAVQDEVVQRILAGGGRLGSDIHRVQSTFVTSLNFAEFLAICTPFLVYFILRQQNWVYRAALFLYLCFHFRIIMWTDSRIGTVGFFVTFMLYGLAWMIHRRRTNVRDLIAPAVALAYPVGLAIFFVLSLTWPRLVNMTWGSGAQQYSTDARKAQFSLMWERLAQNPIGHGMGSGAEALGYTNLGGALTVDSYIIVVAMEYGVIGLIAFFGMILYSAARSYKFGIDLKEGEETLLIPLAIALVVFAVGRAVLGQQEANPLLFMMLGMAAALTHRAAQERKLPLPTMRTIFAKQNN